MTATALPDVSSDQYHLDQVGAPEPSLSSTIARILLTRTPAHAKAQHPRLSDVPLEPRTSDAMDMGTAVHQLLLRDDRVEVADFPDYRKAEARTWRDETRAQGRVPMLTPQWERACAIADAIRERMKGLTEPTPFTAGTPEVTVCWEEDGVWLRARPDWLRDDCSLINDLKVTSRTADPRVWERQLFNYGYDVQAALYRRGVQAVYGCDAPRFQWVVVETQPPYAAAVVELSEAAMFAAHVKVDTAIQLWRDCLNANEWPAYNTDVYIADTPGWARQREDAWSTVDVDEGVPF